MVSLIISYNDRGLAGLLGRIVGVRLLLVFLGYLVFFYTRQAPENFIVVVFWQ